ncbi:fungal-specific transcription factor domain-containing protein [Xylaria cf. heliscus]|nr:fungal-specific transcription factor domain-containing protein [Xylaria cf. heliscus]
MERTEADLRSCDGMRIAADHSNPPRLTCEPCRQKKIKCNRAYPRCSRCVRLGYVCSYRDRASHRASQAALISQLQERVRQAEAKLAVQGQPITRQETSASHPTSASSTQLYPTAMLPSPLTSTSILATPQDTSSFGILGSTDPALDLSNFDFDVLRDVPYGDPCDPSDATSLSPLHKTSPTSLLADPSILATPQEPSNNEVMGGVIQPLDPALFELGSAFKSHNVPLKELQHEAPMEVDYFPLTPQLEYSWGTSEKSLSPIHSIPPHEDLTQLHHVFFERFLPVVPILAKDRLIRALEDSPENIAVRSVSYTMALLAASLSQSHQQVEKAYYMKARYFIDLCEAEEDTDAFKSIYFLQALILLTRFELNKKNCARAWMTLGRTIRLAKMMRLDQMDEPPDPALSLDNPDLPYVHMHATTDIVELEERRRCFWALYILEGFCCVTSGRPGMLEDDSMIHVHLPSTGVLDDHFDPSSMPYVTDALSITDSNQISSFCGAAIVVSLLRRVLRHTTNTGKEGTGFWDRHYKLLKTITSHEKILQPICTMRALYSDPLAFNLHLTFSALEIRLYEAAIARGDQDGLSTLINTQLKTHILTSALRIASTVRSSWATQKGLCDNLSLSSAFVSWPLTMAIKAFSRYMFSEDQEKYVKIIRMLHDSLDEAEGPDGRWQRTVSGKYILVG